MSLFHETPLLKSIPYTKAYSKDVYLKLENTQPSGSFKSRGLGNLVRHYHDQAVAEAATSAQSTPRTLHFFSSSGGNAGLATAVAATSKGHKCTVVVPTLTKQHMRDLITETGAEVVVHGAFWGEADQYLKEVLLPNAVVSGNTQAIYCHPYDDPLLWEGYTTIIKEIKAQGIKPDAIICSVGGGGLYTGLVKGLIEMDSDFTDVPIITAETEGASKMAQSLAQGTKVTLKSPNTVATSLAAFSVSDQAYEYSQNTPGHRTYGITVTDQEAIDACVSFALHHRTIVEPACGAALAVLSKLLPDTKSASGENLPEVVTKEGAKIVVIVCGGSSFSLDSIIQAYK